MTNRELIALLSTFDLDLHVVHDRENKLRLIGEVVQMAEDGKKYDVPPGQDLNASLMLCKHW